MVTGFAVPDVRTSQRMRRVRSRDTGLERVMEKILDRLSVDYEKQPRILGHPDFRIKGRRILIFCDSSFWHGRRRADVSGEAFRKNIEFWSQKLAATKRRDRIITRKLSDDGWTVLRFWDTEVFQGAKRVRTKLKEALNNYNK